MTNKPFGIFVPKKIQKIVYPKEKIDYEKPYILATISRRISVIISFYILNKIGIKPNSVSFFSIFVSFFVLYFFFNSNYFYGSMAACLWVVLDNIDGELARLQNSISNLGSLLEKINSDIFYIILFPSLSIGLYKDSLIDLKIMILTFFSLSLFNVLRPFLANFPYSKSVNKNSKLMLIIACQFKNSFSYRKKSKIGSFIFYLWRNIFTQCGINEILLLLLSSTSALSTNFLPKVLTFFSFGYFFLSIGVLTSLVLHNSIDK